MIIIVLSLCLDREIEEEREKPRERERVIICSLFAVDSTLKSQASNVDIPIQTGDTVRVTYVKAKECKLFESAHQAQIR